LEKHGYTCVEFQKLRSGYLGIPVEVDGNKLMLILDTGAPQTYLDPSRTSAFNWSVASIGPFLRVGGPINFCEVGSISIGQLSLGGARIYAHDLTDLNPVLAQYGEPAIDGLLGGDILGAYSAVVDYARHRVFFKAATQKIR
jgi:hypothetical protein